MTESKTESKKAEPKKKIAAKARVGVKKTVAKKVTPKKTVSKKVTSKKPEAKKTSPKKASSSKSKKTSEAKPRVKAKPKQEKTPFQTFTERSTQLFETVVQEMKDLSKKTSKLPKNAHLMDSLAQLIKKNKEHLQVTAKVHKLNTECGEVKRKLMPKFAQLGKQTASMIKAGKLKSPTLKTLHDGIVVLQDDLEKKEKEIKALLEK